MTIQSTEALRCISVRTDRMGTPAPGDIARGLYHIVVACSRIHLLRQVSNDVLFWLFLQPFYLHINSLMLGV